MSVERCQQCGRFVDTDYDVEGEYGPRYEYYCSLCSERLDTINKALTDRLESIYADS